MIWEFVAAEKANFPIVFMCAEFGVTRQGYYAWERRAAAGGSARVVASTHRGRESGRDDRVTNDESVELRRLRAENRELQMRVELLKKATAFFANDTLT